MSFCRNRSSTKPTWQALRNISSEWSRATHDWKAAMNRFAFLYAERFIAIG